MKIIKIRNRGVGLGTANLTYVGVPIKGDGTGAKATVVINNDSEVETVTVSHGGNGYTYGTLDLAEVGIPGWFNHAAFDVIIPPNGGHGADIYRELGLFRFCSMLDLRTISKTPDFITGNEFARIGICENPIEQGTSTLLTKDKASAVYTLKLVGTGYSEAIFTADSFITQTVGVGFNWVGELFLMMVQLEF